MGRLAAFLSGSLAILVASCGGGGSNCTAGSLGCECTESGFCDPPNTCQGGVCVAPADTGTDTPIDTAPDTVPDTATDDAVEEVECAADLDCDDSDPCTADACDLDYNECEHDLVDSDGDGYPAAEAEGTECAGGTDCLDDLATAFPGAPMVECSLLDNDCNGNADQDDDGDGHVAFDCGGDDCRDADVSTILGECSGVNECCDGCWRRGGCWKDPLTGWLWEDPPAGGALLWDSAVSYCAGLSLAGHEAGDWHLPTISELRTFVRGCPAIEDGGACGVMDSCLDDPCYHDCEGCSVGGGPGAGGCYWDPAVEGPCDWYWSSSSRAAYPSVAWGVSFDYAFVGTGGLYDDFGVRCVSPGP